MRILIDVPDKQISALAQVCKQKQLSRAAVVREAITAYLAERKRGTSADAFGLWRDHAIDGLAYQENLRAEW